MDAAVELFLLKESDTLFVKRDQMFASTFSAVAVSMADCEANTACYFVGKRCERVTRVVEPDLDTFFLFLIVIIHLGHVTFRKANEILQKHTAAWSPTRIFGAEGHKSTTSHGSIVMQPHMSA